MSNLENLKKQAKALVRLHREKSYHLACAARETLPRFAALTDRQILGGEFKLSDAQELIARQHGRQSWAALKATVGEAGQAPARAPDVADGPGLLFIVPILYVADIRRALAFYEGRLGFEVLQVSGEPPFYAEVRRGGASLGLRLVHRPVIDPAARVEEPMLWQASVRVGDVRALYVEFLAAGATIETPLRREPWGPMDFSVRDPDGNVIGFGERGPVAKARDGAMGGGTDDRTAP
jgi:catechol 2,3-dioxygenase-like lactoylglutathione lyase family enzyme